MELEKKDKERDKEKEKEEKKKKENLVKEKIIDLISRFNQKRLTIKSDVEGYQSFLMEMLSLSKIKTKDAELIELIGVSLSRVIEAGIKEKELNQTFEKMSSENKCILMKSFYIIYERISSNKESFGIKANKLIPIHNKLISTETQGGIARSLFSTQK